MVVRVSRRLSQLLASDSGVHIASILLSTARCRDKGLARNTGLVLPSHAVDSWVCAALEVQPVEECLPQSMRHVEPIDPFLEPPTVLAAFDKGSL
ncbi:hypothetical protein GNI_052080 [Gregarina niphandrodes]|uniref:Uncharacterized protein n=1 Tax=Gregarina niphandrodes TaxID=110365 RepID=A0A023B990_GRENI|nr:hypothetical protein GNI_052080 [Gregarina niphandrodes]EZG71890.1 hypothetical protein GNI_052080 [Gregarina niphandrodes]|eukprot:XP_011129800.1 hypothetical protein GNI_052080 [Gregarina niphandrodes]